MILGFLQHTRHLILTMLRTKNAQKNHMKSIDFGKIYFICRIRLQIVLFCIK